MKHEHLVNTDQESELYFELDRQNIDSVVYIECHGQSNSLVC